VLTQVQRAGALPDGQARADLLASFQRAAVDQLVDRTVHAVRVEGVRHVVLSGGVACNGALRERMGEALAEVGFDAACAAVRRAAPTTRR
jgi:N6-L-threonylcarbamoyladenine synthase